MSRGVVLFIVALGASTFIFFQVNYLWETFSTPLRLALYLLPLLIFGAICLVEGIGRDKE